MISIKHFLSYHPSFSHFFSGFSFDFKADAVLLFFNGCSIAKMTMMKRYTVHLLFQVQHFFPGWFFVPKHRIHIFWAHIRILDFLPSPSSWPGWLAYRFQCDFQFLLGKAMSDNLRLEEFVFLFDLRLEFLFAQAHIHGAITKEVMTISQWRNNKASFSPHLVVAFNIRS